MRCLRAMSPTNRTHTTSGHEEWRPLPHTTIQCWLLRVELTPSTPPLRRTALPVKLMLLSSSQNTGVDNSTLGSAIVDLCNALFHLSGGQRCL